MKAIKKPFKTFFENHATKQITTNKNNKNHSSNVCKTFTNPVLKKHSKPLTKTINNTTKTLRILKKTIKNPQAQ